MGITDKQFNAYVRSLFKLIKKAKEKDTKEEIIKELEEIMQDMQSTLED